MMNLFEFIQSAFGSTEHIVCASLIFVAVFVIMYIGLDIKYALRLAKKQGSQPYIYHGTRLPMSVIIEHGVPALSNDDRSELFEAIARELSNIGVAGLKRGLLTELFSMSGDFAHGVYVSNNYDDAEAFAIAAPAFVSEHIYAMLRRAGYNGVHLDYAFLAILDKIGQPKILECNIPPERFIRGNGGYGSVVGRILPEDIIKIHVVSYDTPCEAPRQSIDRLVDLAVQRWNVNEARRKELVYVRKG